MLRRFLEEWRQNRTRNPLWLVLMPVTLALTDIAATLRGQSAAYWSGDYADLVESNLIAWVALRLHPGVFLGGGAALGHGLYPIHRLCAAAVVPAGLFGPDHRPRRRHQFMVSRIASHWFLVGTAFYLVTGLLALPTWRAWRDAWLPLRAGPGTFLHNQVD
ncbi:MAG TPA: hypothetical protein VG013_11950 [Gemmataceae bacterium]|nr:hypothetical protein [Gemmataceae bacterium]